MKIICLRSKFVVAALTMMVALGCSKDGDTGPPGPQGEQGIQGVPGPPGSQGETSNANVIASDWLESAFSDTPTDLTGFSISDVAFTQDVLDTAAVMVFGKQSNADVIILPIAFRNRSYVFGLPASLGQITLIGESIDGTDETFDDFTHVRYLIIPADSTTSGKSAQPDFTKMSYYELVDYLGLDY